MLFVIAAVILLQNNVFSQAASINEVGKNLIKAIQHSDLDIIKSIQATADIYRVVAPSQTEDLDDEQIMSLVNDNDYSMHSKFNNLVKYLDMAKLDKSKLRFIKAKEKKYELLKLEWKPFEFYFDYLGTKDTLIIELFEKDKKWYLIDIANDDKELFNIISLNCDDCAKSFYDTGLESREIRDFLEASHYFTIAAKLDTSFFEAMYENGYALIETGDTKSAEKFLKVAADKDSNGTYHSKIYLELGYIAMNEKNIMDAEDYFKNSIISDSSQYYSYYYLGKMAFDKHDFKDAVNYLQHAVENSSKETYYPHFLIGLSYYYLKDYQKASYALIESLERNPSHIETLYRLGWIYNELKDFQMAVSVFEALLKIEKTNYDAIYELAYAMKNLGYFSRSIELFLEVENALKNNRTSSINYPRLARHLGDCFLELNDRKEACHYYKIANDGNESINPEKLRKACSK